MVPGRTRRHGTPADALLPIAQQSLGTLPGFVLCPDREGEALQPRATPPYLQLHRRVVASDVGARCRRGSERDALFACEVMRDQFGQRYGGPTRRLSVRLRCSATWLGVLATGRKGAPSRSECLAILRPRRVYERFSQCYRRPGDEAFPSPASSRVLSRRRPIFRSIRRAQSQNGGRLSFLGPLYGSAKDAFFDEIDIFLLPTRSESYGLVIIEALSRGVPVIAYARGCIGSYLTAPAGHAIPTERGFRGRRLCEHRRLDGRPGRLRPRERRGSATRSRASASLGGRFFGARIADRRGR